MRRKERAITKTTELHGILQTCKVCSLAMSQDNVPYVVPMNFGYTYEDDTLCLYFHCAPVGKKISIVKQNPYVSFTMYGDTSLVVGKIACQYTYQYRSIIGNGNIHIVETEQDKLHGLNCIMKHQSGSDQAFTYAKAHLDAVTVLKLEVATFTGKTNIA